MADNVGYTAGAGTTIASDDVAGVHYQRVKINDGTADGTNALVVTSRGAAMTEGTIAHDNPVSTTNPVLIGAAAATALPTAVADSDVVRVVADKYGRQRGGPGRIWHGLLAVLEVGGARGQGWGRGGFVHVRARQR